MKSWTKIYQANEDNKEKGVQTIMKDKVDAKPTVSKKLNVLERNTS